MNSSHYFPNVEVHFGNRDCQYDTQTDVGAGKGGWKNKINPRERVKALGVAK